MSATHPTAKQQARALLEDLPDDVTWDDIVYELAVRRSIELGLTDAESGRVMSVHEVRREFNLQE